MPEFWFWRSYPAPRWVVVGKVDVPYWRYVDGPDVFSGGAFGRGPDQGRGWNREADAMADAAITMAIEEQFTTLFDLPIGYIKKPIGSMLCVQATAFRPNRTGHGRSSRIWLLTPPVTKFADLRADPDLLQEVKAGQLGPPDLYVQPEVHAASGEVLQGKNPSEWMNIDLRTAHGSAVQFVSVALDSFLERGKPDPRFLTK